MITDEEYYSVSDNAHFLGGALAVLAPVALGAPAKYALYSGVAIIVFAIIKEGFIDPRTETPEVAGSGRRDFLGYLLGACSALAIYGIRRLWP